MDFWFQSPQPAALSLELSDAIFGFGRSRQANPGVLKSKPSWEDANNGAAGCAVRTGRERAKAQIIGAQ
jgi:hypothetical protein